MRLGTRLRAVRALASVAGTGNARRSGAATREACTKCYTRGGARGQGPEGPRVPVRPPLSQAYPFGGAGNLSRGANKFPPCGVFPQ